MTWCGAWLEICEEGSEDGQGDRLNRFAVMLAVVAFDATDDALDKRRFDG